jgi:ribosome-associated heat shock protein Hsp15
MSDEALSRRIDKWLWCARRFKTRSLASKFVADASVRVTRDGVTQRIEKPSFPLREGDQVSYFMGERLFVLTVSGFADRRLSPAAAKSLYVESGKSAPAPEPPPCKAAG